MLKKILRISGFILLIGFISVFVKGYNYQKTKSSQKDNIVLASQKKQELIDENIITSLLDNEENKETETIEQDVKEEKIISEEVEKIDTTTKENVSQPKQEVQTSQTQKLETKISTPTPEVITPQPKQPTEWEKLGISEYDYYNSPDNPLMTVDFDVNKLGSMEETKNACYNAGANYTGLENYRFRCYETYSYSGKFLGYHIKYFELES